MELTNKHYIRVDEHNRIIKGFSDAFEKPLETDICINENGGRQFEIDGDVNPSLTNFNMCHLYRYEDGKIRKSTEEELRAEYDLFEIVIPEEQPIINIEELKAEISDELLYNFQEGIEDLTICQLETMYQLDLMWMGLM